MWRDCESIVTGCDDVVMAGCGGLRRVGLGCGIVEGNGGLEWVVAGGGEWCRWW